MLRMKLNRKQKETTAKLIDWWDRQGLLNEDQAPRLKESIELKSINWKKVTEYLMGLAVVSIIVAFLTLVADEWILQLFERLFEISDVAILVLLLFLTFFFYMAGWRIHRHPSRYNLSLETLLLLGSLSFGGALNYFGSILQLNGFPEIFLILVFAFHAFAISYLYKSITFSAIGWLAIMLWLALESSRQGSWDGSWMGMNIAFRFVFFSLIPLITGILFRKSGAFASFAKISEQTGWLFFWVSLWGLALFGNHDTLTSWEAASAASLLPWGIVMGIISTGFWIAGRKRHNSQWIWMGGVTLIANTYTQFFLFLWDPLHPALFFTILGVSFWILGSRAETIKR
jgi:uncharacterized membrane protein